MPFSLYEKTLREGGYPQWQRFVGKHNIRKLLSQVQVVQDEEAAVLDRWWEDKIKTYKEENKEKADNMADYYSLFF
jgi:hypothetical protein